MPSTLPLPAAAALLCSIVAASHAGPLTPGLGLLGQREQLLASFDRLPESNLKAMFLRCSRESSRRMLAQDEGALCAMAWDELLERFDGNIDALLAWWRQHRHEDPGGY